jgi:hypothetical protein
MSVKLSERAPDGFVVHSFAGHPIVCKNYVNKVLGLPSFNSRGGFSRIVAEYIYKTVEDAPYLRVSRTVDKKFWQHHWNGQQWLKGKPAGEKIPYRLPELLAADKVYIVEGEKDADRLAKCGLVATTCSEGAGKWWPELNKHFKSKHVVMLPDNDAPGKAHAEQVATNLHGVAASVRIVELPGLAHKEDVSDWLDAGNLWQNITMLAETVPLWEPKADQARTAIDRIAEIERPATLDSIAMSDFVLPAPLAERYREYANVIHVVAPSERPEAFTRCARQVAGMVSDDFPVREAVDRLWATAEATGIVQEYGEDIVQSRLAEAFKNPIFLDNDVLGINTCATDKWNDPDRSIIDDRRGELPEFPIDSLPALQSWIERTAHGAGATPAHVAVPLLGIVSSLIGTARRVMASRSWTQPMTTWTGVVGFSGTSKTPGIDASKRALSQIERDRRSKINDLRRAHEGRVEAAKAARALWKKEIERAAEGKVVLLEQYRNTVNSEPVMPAAAADPGPFVAPRLYVSDVTIERLAVLLQARPQGMLMLSDELAGLFLNMSRYSGGQDNEFWLEAWNGSAYTVERMGRPPISVDHLLVGVVGGLQPDKLARSFKGDLDGMYARMLFSWPSEPPYRPLTNEVAEIEPEVVNALTRIIDLVDEKEDAFAPRTIPLSPEAVEAFERFRQFQHHGKNALDGREREWWAKSPAHVLRLAGTLSYLTRAWVGGAEPERIEVEFVQAAVRLVRDYFWPHSRAALRQIGLNERHASARRVLKWIKADKRRNSVSREDLRRGALGQSLDADQTQNLIDGLVNAGWLREITKSAGSSGGRPARRWLVNPMLFTGAQTAETVETSHTRGFSQFPQFAQHLMGNGQGTPASDCLSHGEAPA